MDLSLYNVGTDDFEHVNDIVGGVINQGSNLPDVPFRDGYSDFLFEEFDWAMTEEFGELVQTLALESSDEFVWIAVLDPEPRSYYFKEFGYYNWWRVPAATFGSHYIEILEKHPPSSPVDSILFNSSIVAWVPESASWAIWGCRDYEVCIFSSKDERSSSNWGALQEWKNVEQALDSWMKLSFMNQIIPEEFSNSMIYNFSSATKK